MTEVVLTYQVRLAVTISLTDGEVSDVRELDGDFELTDEPVRIVGGSVPAQVASPAQFMHALFIAEVAEWPPRRRPPPIS